MRTSVEGRRGCGYRKPGGLYLMGEPAGIDCGLLPHLLDVCPCCGAGVKPSRGWTWVNPDKLMPHHEDEGAPEMHAYCPLNTEGKLGERAGLLWIGEVYYKTPGDWIEEGQRMGFSRRIPTVPRGFKVGETWVLVAHRKAIADWDDAGEMIEKPGIFHIWRPTSIEYVVKGDETEEELASLVKRGIEPVHVVRAGEDVPLST